MAFDIGAFVDQYFIKQMWERTGYNIFNTLTYALIAMAALYLIWKAFKKYDVSIDRAFWMAALSWTVWGASIRVVTDSIDAGTMVKTLASATNGTLGGIQGGIAQLFYPTILGSHILDYGWLTVTPGIYIVTAGVLLFFLAISRKLSRPHLAAQVGGVGVVLNFLMLFPMMVNWGFAIVPIFMAGAVAFLAWRVFNWKDIVYALPVFGQALDGAATWSTISWFGPAVGINYYEQHVLANAIADASPLGFGLFFLVKAGLGILAVYLIRQEKLDERTKGMFLLLITIIGLAPGLRDLLRMLCGT